MSIFFKSTKKPLATSRDYFFTFLFRRKKFPGNCRWRSQAIIDSMEHYEGCRNFKYGNPNFVRLTSGSCNNLTPGRQHYGLVSLPFTRLQPADYAGTYNVGRKF